MNLKEKSAHVWWVLKNYRRQLVLSIAFPFIMLIVLFLRFTNWRVREGVATFVAKIAFSCNARIKKKTIKHLSIAYGNDKSPKEIETIALKSFYQLIRTQLDFLASGGKYTKDDFFSFIEVEGADILQNAYDKGHGVICLVPHLSSWELSAVTPSMLGYPVTAVSKEVKGYFIQKYLYFLRTRRGLVNLFRGKVFHQLKAVLDRKECVLMMIDLDVKTKGVFVDFYGKKTYTPIGASIFASLTDAVVVPMYMIYVGKGKYKFIIEEELPYVKQEDKEAEYLYNTQIHTAKMEEIIRKYPDQWMWQHRRWRTTPETLDYNLNLLSKQKNHKKNI